jgi:hypothetical protein
MYKYNSIIKKAVLVVAILAATTFGQVLFEENFNYPSNDLLTSHGWTAHSGAGTNPIRVFSSGLVYAGYASSSIGNSAKVDTSGEDDNIAFVGQTSGTVYTAFMMSIQKATTYGDYCFHLSTAPLNSYDYVSRFHIKRDASNNIAIGLGKRQLDTTFTGFTYALNTTYLVVIKWQIIAGDSNDHLSLFILSSGVPSSEPGTPTIGPITPANSDPANIGSIALRQGGAGNAPRVIIDGIRVATTWSSAVLGIEENRLPLITNRLTLQISPNPFSNYTNISFNTDANIFRSVKIFDVTGNLVKTLNNLAGSHIIWDARNSTGSLVAPGIYFVVLENNNGKSIGKVILSK